MVLQHKLCAHVVQRTLISSVLSIMLVRGHRCADNLSKEKIREKFDIRPPIYSQAAASGLGVLDDYCWNFFKSVKGHNLNPYLTSLVDSFWKRWLSV